MVMNTRRKLRRNEMSEVIDATPDPDDELPDSVEASFEGDYDSDHLQVSRGRDTSTGLVDSITEGTISIPHSMDRNVEQAMSDQHEINQEIDQLARFTRPGPLDVLHARRMLVRRFFLPVGQSVRLLDTNHHRRYFLIMCDLVDNAAANVAVSTTSINGVVTPLGGATFIVSALAAAAPQTFGPFWHQGEIWAQPLTVPTALSVLEFLDA